MAFKPQNRMKAKHHIWLVVDDETRKRIEEVAHRLDISMAEFARQAVAYALDNMEQE
ncbi:MAG: hypothetical protein ABFS30_16470 [Pseudomonadota bacterium]